MVCIYLNCLKSTHYVLSYLDTAYFNTPYFILYQIVTLFLRLYFLRQSLHLIKKCRNSAISKIYVLCIFIYKISCFQRIVLCYSIFFTFYIKYNAAERKIYYFKNMSFKNQNYYTLHYKAERIYLVQY